MKHIRDASVTRPADGSMTNGRAARQFSPLRAARGCLVAGYLTPIVVIGGEWRAGWFDPHFGGLLLAIVSVGVLMALASLARGYVRMDARLAAGRSDAPWTRRLAVAGSYGPPLASAVAVAVAWLANLRS